MSSRALSFGSAASAYERYRPAYPGVLVDEVLAYAGRAVASALEIGAGTGKATRLFAAHDIAVTATEPDAAMLAELGRHVPDSVRTVRATFEDLPLTARYDLVYAAAALHWTRPEGRCERVGGTGPRTRRRRARTATRASHLPLTRSFLRNTQRARLASETPSRWSNLPWGRCERQH